jgi:hypothetical protein
MGGMLRSRRARDGGDAPPAAAPSAPANRRRATEDDARDLAQRTLMAARQGQTREDLTGQPLAPTFLEDREAKDLAEGVDEAERRRRREARLAQSTVLGTAAAAAANAAALGGG